MIELLGLSEALSLIIGALLAGGGKLVSDFVLERKTRLTYIAAIKAEVSSLCDLLESQRLEERLKIIIKESESGMISRSIPCYDFNSNYFHVFDSLGSEIKFLKESECKSIISFYAMMKAAFDTIRKSGPLQSCDDPDSLAQMCRFLISIIRQCHVLRGRIELLPTAKLGQQSKP